MTHASPSAWSAACASVTLRALPSMNETRPVAPRLRSAVALAVVRAREVRGLRELRGVGLGAHEDRAHPVRDERLGGLAGGGREERCGVGVGGGCEELGGDGGGGGGHFGASLRGELLGLMSKP